MEKEKESNIISTLRSAVLNALSLKVISSGNYKVIEDCDPIRLIDLSASKTITIVGAFHSYIRKIAPTKNKLIVLELNENFLPAGFKKYFMPAGDYKMAFSDSDIVIITGQTLVNQTIDDLLANILPGSQVIVCGPSGNIIPDILFESKVSIIGAVKITEPDVLFDLVGEGGTVFHLFEYCAKKICILRGNGE